MLELLLDKKRKAIEKIESIDWKVTKYVILDFKTLRQDKNKIIEKGVVTYKEKILTKQILYFRIDIPKSHENIEKNKKQNFTKKEWSMMHFANIMFHEEPIVFLEYVKHKQILNKKDCVNFEKAFQKLKEEKEIIDSWKAIKEE